MAQLEKQSLGLPKLGIIAGGGVLPGRLVENCINRGRPFFLILLKDQVDDPSLSEHPHAFASMSKVGFILEQFKAQQCREVVMAGRVKRPSFSELVPDARGTRLLFKLSRAIGQGDDALLSIVIQELEEEGLAVVGAQDLLGELVAKRGCLTRIEPTPEQRHDITRGLAIIKEIGDLDIGQALVIQQGMVLGVEALEGTDGLIQRIPPLVRPGSPAVLVKGSKPHQERRVDLPTIGPVTVAKVFEAGLVGIGVEAGMTQILDQETTIELANQHGIFIYGVDQTELPVVRPHFHRHRVFKVMLVAGEASGDLLGERVMAALQERLGRMVKFVGVGGERMQARGLQSAFPMSDLSVMGFTEILPKLPLIFKRLAQTVHLALRERPDVVLTIDSPGFTYRLAKRLKPSGTKLIHFVAPSVWAWKPGRAKKTAALYDGLLTLLPFEPPYFEKEGLTSRFVGHPVLESGADGGDGEKFRNQHGFTSNDLILLVLPGSRGSEINRLLEPFGQAVALLTKKHPNLKCVVPTVPHLKAQIEQAVQSWAMKPLLIDQINEKYDAFAAADAAMAASGTVSLELALARCPHLVAYKVSALTYFLASRLVRVKFVNLINILLDKMVVPELLQSDVTPEKLSSEMDSLLSDPNRRSAQLTEFAEAFKQLGAGGASPSEQAALAILEFAER